MSDKKKKKKKKQQQQQQRERESYAGKLMPNLQNICYNGVWPA